MAFKLNNSPFTKPGHPKLQRFKHNIKTGVRKLGQNFKLDDNKPGIIGVGLSAIGLTGLGMKFAKQKKERKDPNWR